MKATKRKGKGIILGVGLDNSDGHKRITQGDGVVIAGGSAETHDRMTEIAIKTAEALKRRGETVETADPRRVEDLLRENAR